MTNYKLTLTACAVCFLSTATFAQTYSANASSTATGTNSTAVGLDNTTSGDDAATFGVSNTASGNHSFVAGTFHSNGTVSEADSLNATAVGVGNSVTANASNSNAASAFGVLNSIEDGRTGTAVGFQNTITQSQNATAIGNGNTVSASNATAIGSGNTASHVGSTAIGFGAATSADNQIVLGAAGHTITAQGVFDATGNVNNQQIVTVNAQGNLASVAVTVAGGNDATAGGAGQLNIVDGSITSDDIADGTITSADLSAGVVVTSTVGDAAITEAKIADSAVTHAKLGADVIKRLDGFDKSIERNRDGIAESIAMANIPNFMNADKRFSLGLGVADFDGSGAVAAGFSGRLTDSVAVRLSGSSTDFERYTFGGGLGFQW